MTTLKQVYIETIYKIWCISCDKTFFVNNGNVEDLTVDDVNGVECPHCKHQFLLSPLIDGIDSPDVYYNQGVTKLD